MKFQATGPQLEFTKSGKPRVVHIGVWIDRNKYTAAKLREIAKRRKDERVGTGKWKLWRWRKSAR